MTTMISSNSRIEVVVSEALNENKNTTNHMIGIKMSQLNMLAIIPFTIELNSNFINPL